MPAVPLAPTSPSKPVCHLISDKLAFSFFCKQLTNPKNAPYLPVAPALLFRALAFVRAFSTSFPHSHLMNLRTANVRAMIMGMIIISLRPGRGHIA